MALIEKYTYDDKAAKYRNMTMTFEVVQVDDDGEFLRQLQLHHLTINPYNFHQEELGKFGYLPTQDGIKVENWGYLMTKVVIIGDMGFYSPKKIINDTISGPSEFKGLRDLFLKAFGGAVVGGGRNYLKEANDYYVAYNGAGVPYNDIEVRWYNWNAPSAEQSPADEYYVIVPEQRIITLDRRIPNDKNFTYNLTFNAIRKIERRKALYGEAYRFFNALAYFTGLDPDKMWAEIAAWIPVWGVVWWVQHKVGSLYYKALYALNSLETQAKNITLTSYAARQGYWDELKKQKDYYEDLGDKMGQGLGF